jgi:hypothetical protein
VNTYSYSVKAAGAVALSVCALTANALTLDTSGLQANAVFSLSPLAVDLMFAANTVMTGLGTTGALAPTVTSDGYVLPNFNLPINKVDVSLGLPPFSPLVSPNYGDTTGAALQITRGSRSVTLANFVVDYSKDLVLADITANGITTKGTSLYSFDATDLKIGLNGLTLNMHQQLSNLVFTSSALATFASGLKLGSALLAPLQTLDFGTITIDINGALRTPINATPFTVAAAVPEIPSTAMMVFGLLGMAVVSRRKQQI